jgi:hypothetical protein
LNDSNRVPVYVIIDYGITILKVLTFTDTSVAMSISISPSMARSSGRSFERGGKS